MADILNGGPVGSSEALVILNQLPDAALSQMCHDVLLFLQHKKGIVDQASLLNQCQSAEHTWNCDEIQNAVSIVTYIYRNAAKLHLDGAVLTRQLQKSLILSESAISVLVHHWNDQGSQLLLEDKLSSIVGVGKLVDMEWKLGLAVTSSVCKNLNSPFVTMTLKIVNPSGQLISRTLEMTIPEFQNFSRQFQDMASVLETV